jgi:hypothetical protein
MSSNAQRLDERGGGRTADCVALRRRSHRDRRVVRSPAALARRGRGLPRLRADVAGGLPMPVTRRRGQHDAMAPGARRYGSAHSPPSAARPAIHRHRCERSLGESHTLAAGSRRGRPCSPVAPFAGCCHRLGPCARPRVGRWIEPLPARGPASGDCRCPTGHGSRSRPQQRILSTTAGLLSTHRQVIAQDKRSSQPEDTHRDHRRLSDRRGSRRLRLPLLHHESSLS